MEISDAKAENSKYGVILQFTGCYGSAAFPRLQLFYLPRSLIYKDSAVHLSHGAHCSSEFSILSETLCDLSVSITK